MPRRSISDLLLQLLRRRLIVLMRAKFSGLHILRQWHLLPLNRSARQLSLLPLEQLTAYAFLNIGINADHTPIVMREHTAYGGVSHHDAREASLVGTGATTRRLRSGRDQTYRRQRQRGLRQTPTSFRDQ